MKTLVSLALFFSFSVANMAQDFALGWEGEKILSDQQFLETYRWTENQASQSDGDGALVTSDTALHLHWKFGPGNRSKFSQCYQILSSPIDLSDRDVFGITIRGRSGKSWMRHVELKFESGGSQAVITWENLAHIDRWCNKLVILKSQFSNYQSFNWSAVTVISFAVIMNAMDPTDTEADSGVVSFHNLIAASSDGFVRALDPEPVTDYSSQELQNIRMQAAAAIRDRQNPNGLITTWNEDGSSWLYGQGLALRVLTEEGTWDDGQAVNDFALAAQAHARFLAGHQAGEGYWPRAWHAATGTIRVNLEADNTVWMGDFPWIPGSLAYYYRKSGDVSVLPSLLKARTFLYNLIEPSGKVNTINMITRQQSEVSNYEGYAATLYCLLEQGDTVMAQQVMDYVMQTGWDEYFRLWREGPATSRLVLLVNTWMASLAARLGYEEHALDALSLVGKLLYTRGGGGNWGFDGIGPVAMWYEGTLSYIAAGGPGSNSLFSGIVPRINADGTVPAYNENLGSVAGIWAVNWSSLDATSWLYYAAAQKVPFGYSGANPGMFSTREDIQGNNHELLIFYGNNRLFIPDHPELQHQSCQLSLYDASGQLLGSVRFTGGNRELSLTDITKHSLQKGNLWLAILSFGQRQTATKLMIR
jgi:hypothetical protein